VVRMKGTGAARGGESPGAGAFRVGRPQGRARRIAGVVRAGITNPRGRWRRRIVLTDRVGEPRRQLASGIGRPGGWTGRIGGVVGAQVRWEWTTQRCGLE